MLHIWVNTNKHYINQESHLLCRGNKNKIELNTYYNIACKSEGGNWN